MSAALFLLPAETRATRPPRPAPRSRIPARVRAVRAWSLDRQRATIRIAADSGHTALVCRVSDGRYVLCLEPTVPGGRPHFGTVTRDGLRRILQQGARIVGRC